MIKMIPILPYGIPYGIPVVRYLQVSYTYNIGPI